MADALDCDPSRVYDCCATLLSGSDSINTRQILPVRSTADYARPRDIKLLVDGALGFGNMKADIQQPDSDL